MPYALIDDELCDHPKFAQVDLDAIGLWTLGLSWCSRHLTDGRIPTRIVERYAAGARRKAATIAAELIDVGLWEPVDGGWQYHDFHDHNPSGAEVKERRSKVSQRRAEAGRKGAAKRWGTKQTDGNPDGNGHGKPMANASGLDQEPDPDARYEHVTSLDVQASTDADQHGPSEPAHKPPKGDLTSANSRSPHGKPDSKPMANGMANAWQTDDPVPVPVPPCVTTAVLSHPRGVETAGDGTPTGETNDEVIHGAIRILAQLDYDKAVASGRTIRKPDAYLASCIADRTRTDTADLEALHHEHPDLDADALAHQLEADRYLA